MAGLFKGIIEGVTNLGTSYIKADARVQEATIGVELAKLEAKAKAFSQESRQAADLDQRAADERKESHKDEAMCYTILGLLIITATAPFVDYFWEGHLERVRLMWHILKTEVPQEFWIAFGLLFVAIFGFRGILRMWLRMKMGLQGVGQEQANKGGKDAEKQLP